MIVSCGVGMFRLRKLKICVNLTVPTKSSQTNIQEGQGNGSTFRTIAVVFNAEQAGPVLGWTSAVAAYGAFVIPKVFGEQIKATTPEYALYGFALFYAICLALNWWFYMRPNAYVKNP